EEPTTMGQEQWYCLFRSDAGPMAVPAAVVAEVLETESLVRLAWSPPQVVGLCPCHRDVVPVVRLAPLPLGMGADGPLGPARRTLAAAAGEENAVDDGTGRVVLILKTEHGTWGIQGDSVWTILSREGPESHPPHTEGNGPVLVGTIPHAGTRYGVL